MLDVYTFFKDFTEFRKNSVDLSMVSSSDLAEQCDVLLNHHSDCTVFLGYLEPGWMLEPKQEARVRNVIRKFHTVMFCFHLKSLPFSWKNEIGTVYLKQTNGASQTINDGCTLQSEH
jgi:hypothetical protein